MKIKSVKILGALLALVLLLSSCTPDGQHTLGESGTYPVWITGANLTGPQGPAGPAGASGGTSLQNQPGAANQYVVNVDNTTGVIGLDFVTAANITGGADNQIIRWFTGAGEWFTVTAAWLNARFGYDVADNATAQAHYANTSNPHSVTAAQVGALSTANVTRTPTANMTPESSDGTLDIWISNASTTTPGKIEVATAAETTTGTDATRAVSPDGLAGSDYGRSVVGILVNDGTALTAGDGKAYFRIPSTVNGYNLVAVAAHIQAGTALVTINIYNVTDSVDFLSTALTIDANETDSLTAATPAVINGANDDVATGDWVRIDIDGAGTGTTWLYVELQFQLP